MTLYAWDASHYDGILTKSTMARAKAEGIALFSHKIGEGTGGDDPLDGSALAAGRDAGIEFLGGYHVVRSGPVGPQVDALIALTDRDEPWWRTFPGWFWQPDLERWPYDNVPAETGIAFGQELRRRTGRTVLTYASHSQYGDQLSGWDGPLWNADYVSHTAAGFVAMYPGDDWAPLHGSWRGGWTPYSGQAPTFLQYTSSATIAGLTTCDASAYRGTIEQLRALITGSPPVSIQEDSMRLIHTPSGTMYATEGFNGTAQLPYLYPLTNWDKVKEWIDAGVPVASIGHELTAAYWDQTGPDPAPIALTPEQVAVVAAAAGAGAAKAIDGATIHRAAG